MSAIDYKRVAEILRSPDSYHSLRIARNQCAALCERMAAGELVEREHASTWEAMELEDRIAQLVNKTAENERLRRRVAELEATLSEMDRGIALFPHDAEMTLREKYRETVEDVLKTQRRCEHVASTNKVKWNDAVVEALAATIADAHIRGAKEATKP